MLKQKLNCTQDLTDIYMNLTYFFSSSFPFFRFLHYLDAIHLGLGKNTLQQLAEDFP